MSDQLPHASAERVTVAALHAYLVRHGWTRRTVPREEVVQFTAPAEDSFRILVPAMGGLVDYASMVEHTLRILAEFENRHVLDVLEQVVAPSDVLKGRIEADRETGSVPLHRALALYEGIQDLYVYAASSELRRESVHFPRKLKGAMDLAERSRIGQTEFGSYVATFYFPLPPHEELDLFDDQDAQSPTPLERRAVTRIVRGLSDVAEAARTRDYRVLVDRSDRGFNANMCEVLATLVQESGSPEVDFSVGLDPEWTVDAHLPTRVHVPSYAVPLMETAAQEMRGPPEVRRVEIEGWVYQLHHESYDPQSSHQVRVLWDAPDGTYKVLVRLTPEEYEVALRAHTNEARVSVTGDLQRVGRYWHLLDPEEFVLAE